MKMVIAAGGTGGHLFPGISIAQVFHEWDPKAQILFVVSEKGLEREILEKYRLPCETLAVGKIKGKGWREKVRTLLSLPQSLAAARRFLKQVRPDVVFGIGGYISGPVVLAAVLCGIRRVILEPNSIPGFTNRILARMVNLIFISFQEASRFFPVRKTRLVGTPVRREFTEIGRRRQPRGGVFTLLVLGGSQGAAALNRAMVGLLPALADSGRSFRIIHQTGVTEFPSVQQAYAKQAIPHTVSPFIDDMAEAYRETDLLISRAGASTIAEIIETRTPSILVPFPHATDDHQRFNAVSLVQKDAAEMILNKDLDRLLGKRIFFHEQHREGLKIMSENLAKIQAVPAAEVIAKECLRLVGENVSNT